MGRTKESSLKANLPTESAIYPIDEGDEDDFTSFDEGDDCEELDLFEDDDPETDLKADPDESYLDGMKLEAKHRYDEYVASCAATRDAYVGQHQVARQNFCRLYGSAVEMTGDRHALLMFMNSDDVGHSAARCPSDDDPREWAAFAVRLAYWGPSDGQQKRASKFALLTYWLIGEKVSASEIAELVELWKISHLLTMSSQGQRLADAQDSLKSRIIESESALAASIATPSDLDPSITRGDDGVEHEANHENTSQSKDVKQSDSSELTLPLLASYRDKLLSLRPGTKARIIVEMKTDATFRIIRVEKIGNHAPKHGW